MTGGIIGRTLGYGCLALIVVPVAVFCLFLAWLGVGNPEGHLPSRIRIVEVIESDGNWGFGPESCTYIAYRLHPDTAAALRAEGLAFLGDDIHPQLEGSRNPYEGWFETPLDIPRHGHPITGSPRRSMSAPAAIACRDQEAPFGAPRFSSADHALRERGNYFIATRNRQAMILVDPNHGYAWYLQYG